MRGTSHRYVELKAFESRREDEEIRLTVLLWELVAARISQASVFKANAESTHYCQHV